MHNALIMYYNVRHLVLSAELPSCRVAKLPSCQVGVCTLLFFFS